MRKPFPVQDAQVLESIFGFAGASYVLVIPKRWLPHTAAFGRDFSHPALGRDSNNQEDRTMKEMNEQIKNKGGRPAKALKKNKVITLKCSGYEQVKITVNAKKTGLSVSEYLRELGLHGQVVITEKALPREVLSLMGTLNHMAANLNQVAKKRNSVIDELNAAERASLEILSRELKATVILIKTYLQ